jgi:hypothetical protein
MVEKAKSFTTDDVKNAADGVSYEATEGTVTVNGEKSNYGVLLGFVLAAAALLVVAPAVLSDFRLSLLGRFVRYGIVAAGIGWPGAVAAC